MLFNKTRQYNVKYVNKHIFVKFGTRHVIATETSK